MGNFFTCCSQRRNDDAPIPIHIPMEFSSGRQMNELVNARLVAVNDKSIELGVDPRAMR